MKTILKITLALVLFTLTVSAKKCSHGNEILEGRANCDLCLNELVKFLTEEVKPSRIPSESGIYISKEPNTTRMLGIMCFVPDYIYKGLTILGIVMLFIVFTKIHKKKVT